MTESEPTGIWSLLDALAVDRPRAVLSLWDAVWAGDVELAREFIRRGHDPSAGAAGGNALQVAASNGALPMLEMLLEEGANPKRHSSYGPLTSAVWTLSTGPQPNRAGVVRLLMAAGPSEKDLRRALFQVAHVGDGPTASLLVAEALENGLDDATFQEACEAAATKADERGHAILASFLRGESDDCGPDRTRWGQQVPQILGGPDPRRVDDDIANGHTTSDLGARSPDQQALDASRAMAERELSERIRNGDFDDELRKPSPRETAGDPGARWRVPAVFAAGHGLDDVLAALITRGALAGEGETGQRALRRAAQHGNLGCIAALLAAGVEPEPIDKRSSPLIEAAENGQLEAARALLEAGANPRYETRGGETAMVLADGLDREKIRSLLREFASQAPSATQRSLRNTGKAKPCAPSQGFDAFFDYVFDGHPEWVLLAVRAPLDTTTETLAEFWEAKERLTDVGRQAISDGDGVFALQLREHPWTLVPIEVGYYRLQTADLAERAAPEIASRLGTIAVASYAEDTSGYVGVEEFREDTKTASLWWDSGDVLRFDSDREPPEGSTAEDRLRRYFKDLELFVPALWLSGNGFERQLVLRSVGIRNVERLDYLVLR